MQKYKLIQLPIMTNGEAYTCLNYYSYIHQTVNHQQNFVDPSTHAHIQKN